MDAFDSYLASALRFTTPLLLAALGGLPTWWTRDLNIGLEGFMLIGAFFAVLVGFSTGSVMAVFAVLIVLGAFLGLLFALVTVHLRANVFVVGAALNVLAIGLTVYLLRANFGVKGSFSHPSLTSLPRVGLGPLADMPLVGALAGHSVLTYASWALVAFAWWAARSTSVVRHLKAVGEHRDALAASGGNVAAARLLAQVWCGALCVLAGAQLSLGQLTLFSEGMTAGKGFVALAAVIFSSGGPIALFGVSALFGLAESLSVRMEALGLPPQFPQMLPYLIALAGLVIVSARRRGQAVRMLTVQGDQ